MSVNSAAVLRLMGKGVGGPAPAGVVRGRGAARGGRGEVKPKARLFKLRSFRPHSFPYFIQTRSELTEFQTFSRFCDIKRVGLWVGVIPTGIFHDGPT